jgi:hypothetical protein
MVVRALYALGRLPLPGVGPRFPCMVFTDRLVLVARISRVLLDHLPMLHQIASPNLGAQNLSASLIDRKLVA